MKFFRNYFRYYRVFQKYVGHKTLILGVLSLVVTLSEGFGISIFVTYLQSLMNVSAQKMMPIRILETVLISLGLPTSSLMIIFFLIFVFLARGVLVLLSNSYRFRIYMEMTEKVSTHLSQVFSSLSYKTYLSKSMGYFTNLMTREVGSMLTAFYQITTHIPKVVSILTYGYLSMRLNWRFTLVAVLFGYVMAHLMSIVSRKSRHYSRLLSDSQENLTSLLIQTMHSFKYLYSTASQEKLKNRVDAYARETAIFGAHLGNMTAIVPAASEPLIVIFLVFAVYFQGVVAKGDIGALMVVMMFLYRVMKESTVLQNSWQTFNTVVAGVDKVIDALETLPRDQDRGGSQPFTGLQRELRFEKVDFTYGSRPVIKQLSLSIPSKKTVGIIGESGSGKSTFVDLVTGILRPTGGRILVDAHNYIELDSVSYRRRIGYVTQESVMFNDTVLKNITLWADANSPEVLVRAQAVLKLSGCDSFVADLPEGLNTFVGERGIKLSGGQRQRIAIARELYKQPDLLILDEATSALDSESEKVVQDSIDRLKGQMTILVIAHRLSTLRNCDYIYVFKQGVVVEEGSFAHLSVSGGVFQSMWDLQRMAGQ